MCDKAIYGNTMMTTASPRNNSLGGKVTSKEELSVNTVRSFRRASVVVQMWVALIKKIPGYKLA